ncbi:MAG: hypothetical protein ACPHEP_10180 [Acidimicrobiales bacterium]
MISNFKLPNSLGNFIDSASDFIFGEFVYDDDSVNVASARSRQGGFLDKLVVGGAKAFMKTTMAEEEDRVLQTPEHEGPRFIQSRYRPGQAQRTAPTQIVGMRNADLQTAIRRMMSRSSSNPDMARLVRDTMVRRNIQQGRKYIGIATPQLPKATKMAAADVRKETKVT